MVVEARPVGIHLTAGTQRKHAAQKLHRRMHRSGVGIGAVILRPVTALAARHEQSRKLLVHRHLKIGIGFVVLKADVIARTIFFNQVALQNQRFDLTRGNNCFNLGNLRHHRLDLRRVARQIAEVAAHAVLQHHGLADIDDLARIIMHQINARLFRQNSQRIANRVAKACC